jgi:hypothetical protein
VSLGYSYLNHPIGQSSRSSLNGFAGDLTIRLTQHLAVRGDFGYMRSGNVLGTSTGSSVIDYLGGPVFYPSTQRRLRSYVHALFGAARVSQPVPVPAGILIGGWASRFAWLVGGGFDYQLTDAFGFRGGVDFLRTTYYGPTLALQGQSNIRATVSVVYLFRPIHRRRRR